jgi:hypothetical protein
VNFQQAPGNASALTVTQAPAVTVTYTATPSSREYGLANPALTGSASASGLRAADTLASVTSGAASFATTATPASNVGSYPVAGSGLAGATANYTAVNFQQAAGNASALTVTPAPLTVTYAATPASREYGLENPALAGSVAASGLRNGQTLTQVTTGSASFATPATPASDVGTYPIGGSGLSAASGNYSFAFVQAPANATAFRIEPATLVMTADPVYRYAGSPNPEITGTVSGFRQGDTLQSATTGSLFFTTLATETSAPGAYFAAGQGLGARNYLLVDSPANAQGVIVVPAPVSGGSVPVVGNPRNPESEPTYTYDRNFGPVGMCMAVGPLASPSGVAPGADVLELEWPRVRGRPNLTNCVGVSDRDFCRDF